MKFHFAIIKNTKRRVNILLRDGNLKGACFYLIFDVRDQYAFHVRNLEEIKLKERHYRAFS